MIKLLYMIFIGAIMVGNGIYFGPCTLRQYGAIFFSLYITCNLFSLKPYLKLLPAYFIFIFMYGLSLFLDNNIENFLKPFIAFYLVSIVGYFSTIIIQNKYHTNKYFFDTIIIVGTINSIITILQYFGLDFSYHIGAIFVDLNDAVQESHFDSMMENHRYQMGIMGNIVYNGYYSMLLPFALLTRLKNKNVIVRVGLVIFSLISLFMVGERSCFGITIILLLIYIYLKYKKSLAFYIAALGAAVLMLGNIQDFINSDIIQNSRWVGESSAARDLINSSLLPFIFDNFMFGGLDRFIQLTGFHPHNVIASGFIYAGVIGGICILYILFWQAKTTVWLLRKHSNVFACLAFAGYTLNGFFHNPAIVTGDVMVWILWAIVFYSYEQNRSLCQ